MYKKNEIHLKCKYVLDISPAWLTFLIDITIAMIQIKLGTKTLVKMLGISYLFQQPKVLRDFEGKDKIYTFMYPEVIEMICAKRLCLDAG